MPLHVSSTMCSSSGGQKLYYTASGITAPVGGRPVLLLRLILYERFISFLQVSAMYLAAVQDTSTSE